MKWFEKHTTDRNDLDARQIRSKFGIQGYGIYEVLQQIVAENMEGSDVSEWGLVAKTWTMKSLAEEAGVSEAEFRLFIQFCNDRFIIEKRNGRMFLPKLLERMNEYAKRQYRGTKSDKSKKEETTDNPNTTDTSDISASQHNTSQHNTTQINTISKPTAEIRENPLGITSKTLARPKSGAAYKWQDDAARMADSLGFKPTPSWFKLFKQCANTPQEGLLLSTYSAIADLNPKDPEKYFYKVFAEKCQ